MIGLRIAGACAVVFMTGVFLHAATRKEEPGYKMPDSIGYLGAVGVIGVPVGLILAIFGV